MFARQNQPETCEFSINKIDRIFNPLVSMAWSSIVRAGDFSISFLLLNEVADSECEDIAPQKSP
jgi:hypothetical protein